MDTETLNYWFYDSIHLLQEKPGMLWGPFWDNQYAAGTGANPYRAEQQLESSRKMSLPRLI